MNKIHEKELVNRYIDDMVKSWHYKEAITISLHEYIGFTWHEYQNWILCSGVYPDKVKREAFKYKLRGEKL
jgi:hypothetical protein